MIITLHDIIVRLREIQDIDDEYVMEEAIEELTMELELLEGLKEGIEECDV